MTTRRSQPLFGIGLLALLALLPGAACGRKTDVKPPELVAPEVVGSLTARNTPDGIRVGWGRPRVYADGTTMRDLAGFRVERGRGEGAFELIATVPVVDRDRFRQKRHFDHLDTDVQVGERYRYRIRAFTEDGHTSIASDVAEQVRAIPVETPQAKKKK